MICRASNSLRLFDPAQHVFGHAAKRLRLFDPARGR